MIGGMENRSKNYLFTANVKKQIQTSKNKKWILKNSKINTRGKGYVHLALKSK